MVHNRPRIGIRIPREQRADALPELAERADRAGLDEIWLVEDCFYAGALPLVTAALAATERITVGIGIMPAVAHNPAITAMELATIAALYPGRLIAGFGHGVAEWMRQIGAFPQSQLAALDETLVAIRALLAGERVSMTGRHVTLDEVELEFPPSVPPTVVAGVRGPKSLAVSGKSAAGTLLAEPSAPEYVRAARTAIEQGRTADTPRHTVTSYNWFAVDDDPERARERVRLDLASSAHPGARAHLTPLPFAEDILTAIAPHADVAERARQLRPEWIDRLTVSGDLRSCVDRVRELHAAGSESVVLCPPTNEPVAAGIDAAADLLAALR